MRKASDIVLLIGMILGFVATGILFIVSILFFVFGSQVGLDLLHAAMEESGQAFTEEETQIADIVWVASFISTGVVLILVAIFSCLSAVFALMARSNPKKGNYIVALVFGVLGGNEAVLVGSIFGLISCKDDKKPEVVEAEEKEEL